MWPPVCLFCTEAWSNRLCFRLQSSCIFRLKDTVEDNFSKFRQAGVGTNSFVASTCSIRKTGSFLTKDVKTMLTPLRPPLNGDFFVS